MSTISKTTKNVLVINLIDEIKASILEEFDKDSIELVHRFNKKDSHGK